MTSLLSFKYPPCILKYLPQTLANTPLLLSLFEAFRKGLIASVPLVPIFPFTMSHKVAMAVHWYIYMFIEDVLMMYSRMYYHI